LKAGRLSAENEESSGRPSTRKTTENVGKIREFIHEYRRRTIHAPADAIGIGYGVCQEILTENLNMLLNAAKFVPRLTTNDQKERCLELREG
jgi:hypothetical protein